MYQGHNNKDLTLYEEFLVLTNCQVCALKLSCIYIGDG